MTRLCDESVPPGNSIPWEIPKGILEDTLGERGALLVPLNPLAGGGGTVHRGGWSERAWLCFIAATMDMHFPGALQFMKPPPSWQLWPRFSSSHSMSRLNTDTTLETGVTGGGSPV